MVKVVKVDPLHPVLGRLVPYVIQRVLDYAKAANPEVDAENVARVALATLAVGGPTQILLAFVDEQANVVGHLLAGAANDGKKWVVSINQLRSDQNVGDAGKDAVQMVEQWARETVKAETLTFVAVGNQGKRWEERGFKPVRTIMVKELTQQGG